MDSNAHEPCFFCAEPARLDALICAHCRQSLAVDVALDHALSDGRVRYRLARSLASLGAGMPPFIALTRALGEAQPIVARGVTRALARQISEMLAPEGLRVTALPAASRPRPERRAIVRVLVVAAVACGLTGVGAAGWVGWRVVRLLSAAPAAALPTPAAKRAAVQKMAALSTRELAERSLTSAVSLRCADSVASGFFVTADTVLTSAHALCASAATIEVVLADGSKAIGVPVRSDGRLDLALVRVAGVNAKPLPLGDAAEVAVGDKVVLIGSPVGLEFTVHEGSISSLARSLRGLAYIQIDAKVNPGNSGGPLLDGQGRVVGVVSLKHTAAEGIALALPINYAYVGAERLVAPPADLPSPGGFEEGMMARARSSASELDEAPADAVQLPMLVAASLDQYERLVAHVVQPAGQAPGYRMVTVRVWVGTEVACTLKGDIATWTVLDENAPPLPISEAILARLAKTRFDGRLYLGGAPLRWDLCPHDRVPAPVVLELEDSDPEWSRLRLVMRP